MSQDATAELKLSAEGERLVMRALRSHKELGMDLHLGDKDHDLAGYIATLEADRARLDVLEKLAWEGRITIWLIDRPIIEVTQLGDTSVELRSHSFREAADSEISRREEPRP